MNEALSKSHVSLSGYLEIVSELYEDDELEVALQAANDAFKASGWPEGEWTGFYNQLVCEYDARQASDRHDLNSKLSIELSRGASRETHRWVESASVEAFEQTQRLLRMEFVRPVMVTVFVPDAAVDFIHGEHGYAAHKTHLDKICIPWSAIQSHEICLSVLRHEFCHVAQHHLAMGKSIPDWLAEGLAMYAGERQTHEECRRLIVSDGRFKRLLSTDHMTGALGSAKLRKDDPELVHAAYAFAASIVDWWIEQQGIEGVRNALARIGDGQSPEHAIAAAAKASIRRMEHEWSRWLLDLPYQALA